MALLPLLSLVVWLSWPREDATPEPPELVVEQAESVPASPSQPKINPPAEQKPVRDPRDYLVLFGYRNPDQDLPPNLISVGWLANSQNVVVPAEILRGFENALTEAKQEGLRLRLCVLIGTPVDVVDWSYPAACPEIAVLTTAEPIAEVDSISTRLITNTPAHIGKLMERGKAIWHCSYERLPRAAGVDQPMISLVSYSPGMARQLLRESEVILELSPQGDTGRLELQANESHSEPLEPGGLLLDSDQKILAMCLPTGDLVWSDKLLNLFDLVR
jgi:hypothetical protein